MDCNCSCFGVAASSKIPVKRYNLLVPDIFPPKSPPLTTTVDASTERKFKKLWEYVQPAPWPQGAQQFSGVQHAMLCIPTGSDDGTNAVQVSRRLARKVSRDLSAQRFGYVQVAVRAYVYLLQRLAPADSGLFARELVVTHVVRLPPCPNASAQLPHACHLHADITGASRLCACCGAGQRPRQHCGPSALECGECWSPLVTLLPIGCSSAQLPTWRLQVGSLLQSSNPEMAALGAQLLAVFVDAQVRGAPCMPWQGNNKYDNLLGWACLQEGLEYAQQLHVFVPLLCERVSSEGAGTPSQPGAQSDASNLLTASCLHALRAVVRFGCVRIPSIAAVTSVAHLYAATSHDREPPWQGR